MSNEQLVPGITGRISSKRLNDGRYEAWARYGAWDGTTKGPLRRKGASVKAAENAVKVAIAKALENRTPHGAEGLNRNSRFSELIALWVAKQELRVKLGKLEQSTLDTYLKEIFPNNGQRAKKETIKILTALGNFRMYQMTGARLDSHVDGILAQGKVAKAYHHRVILGSMMDMAVVHDAALANPVKSIEIELTRGNPKALGKDALARLRVQLRDWAAGKAILGCPAPKRGPKRDRMLPKIADFLLGSGCRPGEGLAARRCDIRKDGGKWRFAITGTLVPGEGGYVRKERTKTGAQEGYAKLSLKK